MAGQEAAIGALGALIFSGIFGRLFLRHTGFSDVFILLIIGAVAGAFLPYDAIQGFSSLMLPLGAVALLMIILEEGLHLSIASLVRHAHKSLFLGAASFFMSFTLVLFLSHFVMGFSLPFSLVLGTLFSAVAPELLSGFLSAMGASENVRSIGELESVFSEALSVILTLIAVAIATGASVPFSNMLFDLPFSILVSVAMGGFFAAIWKGGISRLDEENEHLSVIGVGAVLYAAAGLLSANGVIAVFFYALLIGNSSRASISEVKRFQSEISFFLRTFFFVYLGVLLFHSPKPLDVGMLALALSLLLVAARLISGRALAFLEVSLRAERLLETVSSRGLTVAVLSVIAAGELGAAGVEMPVDLPLLALFVILFTNLLSAIMVLRRGRKRLGRMGGSVQDVLRGGLHGA